jgi:uncharacterized membrane protein YbhN (UPF0104 family)
MSTTAPATSEPRGRPLWKRLLVGALLIVVCGAFAQLLGWNIRGWFSDVWDTITGISGAYIAAAILFKTLQTSLAAFSWYSILRFAYPGKVRLLDIVACYAASVAMNSVLPANIGTFALLIMFATIIAGATFMSILGAYGVQKIFFTVIGAFVYLYLFLSVSGSFDIKFSFVHEHPWTVVIMLAGAAYLVFVLCRRIWPRILHWWDQAKEGGAILGKPRTYMLRVFLPSLLSWISGQLVTSVFLAAYSIPVTFDTLMRIQGGNSIANMTSATPGGAGVNQAFNVASLKGVADSTTATAYSVAQQLVTTAWNLIFAVIMLVWAFGWAGGKGLVQDSYVQAKEKAAEQRAAHAEKKAAAREAKQLESS